LCHEIHTKLAAFRTPFLGSNGSFGFPSFGSFDHESNGLNFSPHGFRPNKSPVNLYSNSPTSQQQQQQQQQQQNNCGGGDTSEFCYQNNNNNNNVHLNKNLGDKGSNFTNNNYHHHHHQQQQQQQQQHHDKDHENNIEVNSREDSPPPSRDNFRVVDSPENKRADTCSPEESLRSYSSQKNDGCSRSPIHNNNDSLGGSQSPENLSKSQHNHHHQQQQQQQSGKSHLEMLDHKLQMSFLGPPLAALHSMAEMKSQSQGSPQTTQNSQGLSNPHGIDSILSRPTPVTSAQLNALGGVHYKVLIECFSLNSNPSTHLGGIPRFSIAAAAANMAQYLSQNQGSNAMKSHSNALVERTHLYWPGLQGLVANPMAWRDRLGSSES